MKHLCFMHGSLLCQKVKVAYEMECFKQIIIVDIVQLINRAKGILK